MSTNMTFTDFVTPIPADWLNNVNTYVNTPHTFNYTAPYTGATTRTVTAKLAEWISVTDFAGVDPTGVSDSTAGIQAALTAAGVGGRIYFPAGTYLVSATLNALNSQQIQGAGPNSTIIRRFNDYGDTLYFSSGGACAVRGMWFYHGTMPTAPWVSLTNQITAFPNSGHIHIQNGQGVVIEDVWAWRMPYQINLGSGSLFRVHRCNIQGVWDGTITAGQEGRAALGIGTDGYIQLVDVNNVYCGGSANGPRNVTYTSSDTGAHVLNTVVNVGSLYAMQINQCEGLVIDNCYMGGNWNSNIFANIVNAGVAIEWRITNNFFDGAGAQGQGACIYFTTQANGTYTDSVVIQGNHFNSELVGMNHIVAYNGLGTSPALAQFTISNNNFQASVGSAMMLYGAQAGTISNNTICGYNSRNFSAGGDITFSAGVFVGTNCRSLTISDNIIGGNVNSGTGNSFCWLSVARDATTDATIITKNNLFSGAGPSGNWIGKNDLALVNFTSAGNYNLQGWEDIVVVAKSVGGATVIGSPPASIVPGYRVTIKDGRGDAATNNITFSGTVDGVANPSINTNFGKMTLLWNGTQFNSI